METRRKRKADEGGAAVEKIDRRPEKVDENAEEGMGSQGSRRPRRAASKGILSAIEAAQGPRRAARKKAAATDETDKKAKESENEAQKGAKKKQVKASKASKKTEVTCGVRPKRGAGKKDGQEVNSGTKEREAEPGIKKMRKTKALKPEDIVQMLGNDAEEGQVADRIYDDAPSQPPSKKVKDPKTSKMSGKNAGGKKTMKKLKPDEIREMLDCGENLSKDEKEDIPAKKTATKLIARDVSKRSADTTTDKVPVYRIGRAKAQDDKKTADIDIYDAFNPIYNEEFGPEDKKMKARRAAKARRLAKKKEEAKIILTFGAAARENVVPAIKTLKNLKTPTQQNRRPLKAMNQMRSALAPSVVVRKASSQNPLPTTIPNQDEVAGGATLMVPKAKAFKKPTATVPPPPTDFSDMASCGADAYFPSYVENETGTSYDATGMPAYHSQAEGEDIQALPVQHKNYKTPAVPRHIGRRIDGKVSTPREQPVNVEDRDTKLSTKELVKKCFGFDSDDTGSEMDNDSLTDISPVRGVMGPPLGNLSMSRLSTLSIPDKASSTFVAGKSYVQEMCVGPYRANLPTKIAPRHTTAIRGKKPPSKFPCNVPSKMSSTAKLDMPPPKVIDVRERVKAVENNGKKEQRASMVESHEPTPRPDSPTPGCSEWSDNYAAAVDGEDSSNISSLHGSLPSAVPS